MRSILSIVPHPLVTAFLGILIPLCGQIDAGAPPGQDKPKKIQEKFPYFGTVTMKKIGDEKYEGKVDDTQVGPIIMRDGVARIDNRKSTITFNDVTFLDNTFTVVFDKEAGPLTSGFKAQRVIAGKIQAQGTVEVLGVPFKDAQIVLNEVTEQLLLEGRFTKFGLNFIGQFIASKQTKTLAFDASLEKSPDNYRPFAHLGGQVPDVLNNIRITKVEAGIQAGVQVSEDGEVSQDTSQTNGQQNDTQQDDTQQDDTTYDDDDQSDRKKKSSAQLYGAIYIKGVIEDFPLVDQPLSARIEFGYKDGPQASVSIGLPEGWKLTNLLPEDIVYQDGQKTDAAHAIDSFVIKSAMFLATTQEELFFRDIYFERGFNVYAKMGLPEKGANPITDVVRNMYSDLNIPLMTDAELFGNFDPQKGVFSVDALSSFTGLKITINNTVFDEWKLGFKMDVRPKKATFGFVGQGDMQPPNQDRPVRFSGGFEMETPTQVGGFLSMVGTWKDPFGIKGISVGDLSISGKQSIAQISSTAGLGALIPAEMGLTGTATIDFTKETSSSATFTLQAGTDVSDWAFDAHIEDAPNFPEIAAFVLRQLNQPVDIPTDNIVPIEVDTARIYFVPLGTNIGAVRVEQGIGCELDVTVLGHQGKLYTAASLSEAGITCKGSLDPVHIGPFHLTGVGDADKPQFDYQLNLKNQHAIVKGNAYIGDKENPIMQSRTNMEISPNGVSFMFNNQFGPFEACISGGTKSINDAPDDFELTADFQQSILNTISNALQKAGKAIAEFFKNWQSSREKFTYEIDKQKQDIVEKKRSIRKLEKKVSREIEETVDRKVDELVQRKKDEIVQRKKEKEKKRKPGKEIQRGSGGTVSRL